MSACCVSGCKNRHSATSKLKFYRIPSGYRPFQANRRRLWREAIQKVNGSTEELNGNARICGAHFISGEASLEHDSPDFVPSVFTCAEKSSGPKKKAKWFYGRRKRRRRTANLKEEEKVEEVKSTPPGVDSPVDLQSSVLMEETEAPSSPSVPKEGETLTKEAETETETVKSQTTSSPNRTSPSFKIPAGIPELDKRIPIVLLKPVFSLTGGYQCELCNQNFPNASQLVKHKQGHEEEESIICEICGELFTSQADFSEHQHVHEHPFPCNMCDRSFTSSHNLKRHKLLHVKDGRKCPKCGVLFCRQHNHILFLPRPESEQDSSIIESQDLDSDSMPENDVEEDAQSTMTITPLQTTTTAQTPLASPEPGPLSKTLKASPPASHTRILSEIPVPVFRKPSTVLCPPPPVPRYSRNYPSAFVQPLFPPHSELPPSLKMFSPQYLTSALLKVKRNYEYILSKPIVVKKEKDIVKEEQCELPLNPPEERKVEHNKKQRTAYDLEIVL